jgi:cyclomaltodextrinase / maltogenic alpha-amylase / neopullulanase
LTGFSEAPKWVRDAVFYQIFPDRFASSVRVPKPGPLEPWDAPPTPHGYKGGDLLGIVDHLDYLVELGITALYLTPIFSSASNHRYHTYDYYQVDPLLGGNDALRELLDACHARHMRVVLDGVFNHSGRGFWPFHHVLENGVDSPYVDWLFIDRHRLAGGGTLKPYPNATERSALDEARAKASAPGEASLRTLGYTGWWDLPALPKLNTNNPGMREHLLGAAEHWLRFGIDGWRLDVAEEIDAGFWREFRQRVRAINPDAYIVAEIWRTKPEWTAGDTFDALMNYPLTEAIISFAGGPTLDMEVVAEQHEYDRFVRREDAPTFAARVEAVLAAYGGQTSEAQLNLLGSHDTARLRTVVGNDEASVRLAMLAMISMPGAPCIYYGDEIGLEGRHDPDCRRAFPWQESRWNADLLAFVKAALRARRESAALRSGEYRTLAAAGEAIAYARLDPAQPAVVVLNAGKDEATLEVSAGELGGFSLAPVALPGAVAPRVEPKALEQGRWRLTVAGRTGAVLLGSRG